jgi:hypothetical protein
LVSGFVYASRSNTEKFLHASHGPIKFGNLVLSTNAENGGASLKSEGANSQVWMCEHCLHLAVYLSVSPSRPKLVLGYE